jgi:hypothetical protein
MTDKMPAANDAAAMKRWHNERGLPWSTPYEGPDPITIRRMQPAGTNQISLSVHLANEHGIDSRKALYGDEVEHMHAHLIAQFRSGQEHYHQAGPR